MLYVTTRDRFDAYTTPRVLCEPRGDDDGYFIPMNMPCFSREELLEMTGKGFSHCVAEMLNIFFGSKLTSWDVEFCIGRHPVKLQKQMQQIYMAELWHNLDRRYDRLEKTLIQRLNEKGRTMCPDGWLRIAVKIAVIFGVYAQLLSSGFSQEEEFDVALTAGEFPWLMAFFYARTMGLPLGKVICASEDSAQLWDFLRSGHTALGGRNSLPEELERLICCEFGWDEAKSFAMAYSQCNVYTLPEEGVEQLRQKLFVSVVSASRYEQIIPNVYHTNGYILAVDSATAYSALQDYRAKNGGMRTVLVLCKHNPVCDAQQVSGAMDITPARLKELIGEN